MKNRYGEAPQMRSIAGLSFDIKSIILFQGAWYRVRRGIDATHSVQC
ncbi:MAG: hypothetical protein JWL80_354 [Parcubacteria group bacterium]|nr:hypothetical protein [Parcubacteria group bacterium]